MFTKFHNEPDDNSSSVWNTGPGPIQFPALCRSRRWLIPALTTAFVLIIIIAFGVSSSRMSGRLWTLEESVSNLSQSLSDVHRINKDAVKDVQRLNFSVEANKDQLTSVAESLKQLSGLDSLRRTVASLRCSLERLIHNNSEAAGCCPLDWERLGSSCYLFSKTALNWHDARDSCNSQQSQLLILSTDKDWDLVVRQTQGTLYWVGLTDERGKWEWVNGTPYIMDRRRWRPGQPDSWTEHGLGEGDEDCAHLHSDGRLNDLHCSTRMNFICQKHAPQSS